MNSSAKEPTELRTTPWHVRKVDEVVSELQTDGRAGLSADEADRRLERYGRNEIRSGQATPWWKILLRQIADPLIYILIVAAVVSVVFDEYVDALVILAVVVINGIIGFVQEYRARKAIQSLAKMTAPRAHVLRDGRKHEIQSEEVVPGDIIVLAAGGRVPADARLLTVQDLQADEAALTGESQPVFKQTEPVEDEKAVPGDQFCMVFSGTSITRGRACAVVVHTGDASELGNIARQTSEMAETETPLQQKIDRMGKAIGIAVLVLASILFSGGLLTGVDLNEVARITVALAVAAIPEGLPIVLTVVLAVGVQRMARRNAIIRSLPAVETLGSTTVIGSDKTGTLTKNQMTVKVIWAGGQRFDVTGSGYDRQGEIKPAGDDSESKVSEAVRLTLLAGLLANEAEGLPGEQNGDDKNRGEQQREDPNGIDEDDEGRYDDGNGDREDGGGGDPTELALLVAAIKAGFDLNETQRKHTQIDMIPFESDRQFMATLNDTPDGRCVFLKGSPEAVLDLCGRQFSRDGEEEDLNADAAREMAGTLADQGYRVLGMAMRDRNIERFENDDPGSDLVFVGFQGMEDPVRPEAVEAVRAAKEAGIRVIMLTGDHVRTARAIGEQLGLGGGGRAEEGKRINEYSDQELDEIVREVNVYARVSPDHKLKLVERLKAQGHIVAVTGDGVNDAPALQAAHLGVAMGRAGTDVTREASDMVLADDNFASITNAVEEGRVVFSNIRKVTYFLLSTSVGEVLTILSSFVGPWPLVFIPTQVLWINLVTNGVQDSVRHRARLPPLRRRQAALDGVRSFLETRGIELPEGQPDDSPTDQDTVHGLGIAQERDLPRAAGPRAGAGLRRRRRAGPALARRGLATALITSSRNGRRILEAGGAGGPVRGGGGRQRRRAARHPGKPAPDIFLHAARAARGRAARGDRGGGRDLGRRGGAGGRLRAGGGRRAQRGRRPAGGRRGHRRQRPARGGREPAGGRGHGGPTRSPTRWSTSTASASPLDDRRLALFFDYDGTLTPIVRRPEDAR
jgi:magnesium-transporting ATPase (P-type)